jgi:hypothetical protein
VLPWALLVAGSAASLAANVAVADPTATGRVIAAWPSFSLIAAYEFSHPVDQMLRDVALGRHAAGGATDVRACGARCW